MRLIKFGEPARAPPWFFVHSFMLGDVLVAIEVPETASKSGETAAADFPFVGIAAGVEGFISGVWTGLGGDSGNDAGSLAALPFLKHAKIGSQYTHSFTVDNDSEPLICSDERRVTGFRRLGIHTRTWHHASSPRRRHLRYL